MQEETEVLIIGGGIIGVACADELARRGVSVTLVDKGEVGFGCSYGNAGWITPCFALPLPMPGMFWQSIRWLLDPDSPLYIQPRLSSELLRWLVCFGMSMNRRCALRSVAALTALAKYSLKAYRQLDVELAGDCSFVQKGLLVLAESPHGLDAATMEMELVAAQGISGRHVTADEAIELVPLLAKAKLLGGVYFPDEAHVEPLATVQGLAKRAEEHGARIWPRTEVFDFIRRDSTVSEIQTTRGMLRAKQYVLATGSWSNRIAQALGFRAPILGGKGYALVVEPIEPQPAIPMMLIDRKIAITPRRDSLRIAGTLELVAAEDDSITERRVRGVLRGALECFQPATPPRVLEVWRGLRPCTPDGVPIIDRAPGWRNLFVATGHQMLGLYTAPGTARLLADIILGSEPVFDPRPFRSTRFV